MCPQRYGRFSAAARGEHAHPVPLIDTNSLRSLPGRQDRCDCVVARYFTVAKHMYSIFAEEVPRSRVAFSCSTCRELRMTGDGGSCILRAEVLFAVGRLARLCREANPSGLWLDRKGGGPAATIAFMAIQCLLLDMCLKLNIHYHI